MSQQKTSDTDMDAPLDGNGSEILITITTHYKVQWRTSILSKSSQHILTSSQTLGDLFEVMPCVSNELPNEIIEDGELSGYQEPGITAGSSGYVIVINDLAYGDGLNEEDYAECVYRFPAFLCSYKVSLVNSCSI